MLKTKSNIILFFSCRGTYLYIMKQPYITDDENTKQQQQKIITKAITQHQFVC